jgi:ATP phosphoribosyltransferase
MNERIGQLAEQAGFTVENGHIQSLAYKQTEKLIELIVRECADVAAKVGEGYVKMGYTVPLECSDKIKQHFGVE